MFKSEEIHTNIMMLTLRLNISDMSVTVNGYKYHNFKMQLE